MTLRKRPLTDAGVHGWRARYATDAIVRARS